MRLDKYLSHTMNLSRSEARQAIARRLVLVNQKTVLKIEYQVNENEDLVSYLGQNLDYRKYVYLMLNKPKNYLSSTKDGKLPTVLDLITGYESYDLFMAGRLDFDSEGLMILTNDGSFAHQLTSPNYQCPKTYQVNVDGFFTVEDIQKFREGIMISNRFNQPFITKPAILEILGTSDALITITEGKYHQVKKMCLNTGKKVKSLKRIRIGNLDLDQLLKPGEYRELTEEEISSLKK